ncbi:MAG: PDR/VanB family oxidoreductase [Alphaproteobacteria bacterium]|nr:PDR/VanB family oxidoreductase [Alphaproteobacteria bacterium]
METQKLIIKGRKDVALGIVEWTLTDPDGKLLPGYHAGAHIDVFITPQLARAYSLTQPSEGQPTQHYVMAVSLAAQSRGGSAHMHQHWSPGGCVEVGLPRNLFAMADSDDPVLLVAGGIGITPLLAMAREREAQGRGWHLVLAARSRAHAAYVNELQSMPGVLQTHFDDEHGGRPLDVSALFHGLNPATQVYCCGPQPLMDKVREVGVALGHPVDRLHFESFGGAPAAPAAGDRTFNVHLKRSGQVVEVPVGVSILDALELAGVIVPSVCREGNCGSCECMVIEGELDHRDQILSEQERQANKSLMICVSRAKSERLVIDL